MTHPAPIGSLSEVVFDCPNPLALAQFYQGVLGGVIEPDGEEWVDLVLPGGGLRVAFQLAPRFIPPEWPSERGEQQIHLDIAVSDLDEAQETLFSLGARLVDKQSGFRVYLDPAGHPFCTVH